MKTTTKLGTVCFATLAASCVALAACSGDTDEIGGATVATNRLTVGTFPTEAECQPPRFDGPDPDYYTTPPDMLDWTPTQSDGQYTGAGFRPRKHGDVPTKDEYRLEPGFIGANEGRVREELRAVAKVADPVHALCLSAQSFGRGDAVFGKAYADLAVTGRASFRRFVVTAPNEATLADAEECVGTSGMARRQALRRAYDVATMVRVGTSREERQNLGWIAVSGEDDQPHRPVNVPSATMNSDKYADGSRVSFAQHELAVAVPGKPSVTTRYIIAHARPPIQTTRALPKPLVDGGPRYQVPADAPVELAADAEVILFLHGMDSRLEESQNLLKALHEKADESGKNWTIISFDLPSSGYADNIDHLQISSFDEINRDHNRATPLVDFIEDYIVAFVDTLETQIPGVSLKSHVRAIVGGSLGGNMSMRLGRRQELSKRLGRHEDLSWIRNVVPWSPAAIWPSFANDATGKIGHVNRPYAAVKQSLTWAGQDPNQFEEKPQRRMELFYGGFDWRPAGAVGRIMDPAEHKPQSELWFSDGWSCKQGVIMGARLDRHETYDANFRRWHWRLGGEQLLFSQQETFPSGHYPSAEFPALYTFNTARTLLSCGELDVGGDLCAHTRYVATLMANTPGEFRLAKDTGHSVDNERPRWMAAQIIDFLK